MAAVRVASSRAVQGATAFILIVGIVAAPYAQTLSMPPAASATPAAVTPPVGVDLLVGRSTVIDVPTPITRVSLTTPDVADAMVTTSRQLLVHGKAPGTISLFVWDRSGAIRTYEVNVRRDLASLGEQLMQLFPGEPISVTSSGKEVVIAGTVSSKYVVEKAADVAAGYVEKKEHVVNLLRQQEGVASDQVMLRVRFAEVSRSALQELGASFFTGINGSHDWIGRSTTQQFPAPIFDAKEGGLVFSDFLNIFLFNMKENVGTLIKALSTRGLFQSLAEPNLIAQNGKEASFLAGGEFPYPAVQGGGANLAITIVFKEFGIRLNFTPTIVAGDLIHLKVRPEVSSLDFTNAISFEGFRVPTLSTRRTETEVELRDGQTFAIAGLLNNTVTESFQKIPGIGDIPILGNLFRSRALQKNQTELVVMITPQILKRDSTGVSPGLPNLVTPFLEMPKRSLPAPAPYVGSPHPQPRGSAAAPAPETVPSAPADPAQPVTPAAQAPSAQAPAQKAPATTPPPPPIVMGLAPIPPAPVPPAMAPVQAPAGPAAAPAPAPAAVAGAAPDPTAPPPPPAAASAARPTDARARKDQQKQQEAYEKQQAEAAKRAAAQAVADRRAAESERKAVEAARKKAVEEQKQAAKRAEAEQKEEARRQVEERKYEAELSRQRAKEDAEEAKRAAAQAKRTAEETRRLAEAAKKQAEVDRKKAKAKAEAEAKLKAAQTAYEAELQRLNKQDSQQDSPAAAKDKPSNPPR